MEIDKMDITEDKSSSSSYYNLIIKNNDLMEQQYRDQSPQLPREVWILILGYLPLKDLMSVSFVDFNMYNLAQDNYLWKSLYLRRWNVITLPHRNKLTLDVDDPTFNPSPSPASYIKFQDISKNFNKYDYLTAATSQQRQQQQDLTTPLYQNSTLHPQVTYINDHPNYFQDSYDENKLSSSIKKVHEVFRPRLSSDVKQMNQESRIWKHLYKERKLIVQDGGIEEFYHLLSTLIAFPVEFNRKAMMTMYTIVFQLCIVNYRMKNYYLPPLNLYRMMVECCHNHLYNLLIDAQKVETGPNLLRFYLFHWQNYIYSIKRINIVFRYYHRDWVSKQGDEFMSRPVALHVKGSSWWKKMLHGSDSELSVVHLAIMMARGWLVVFFSGLQFNDNFSPPPNHTIPPPQPPPPTTINELALNTINIYQNNTPLTFHQPHPRSPVPPTVVVQVPPPPPEPMINVSLLRRRVIPRHGGGEEGDDDFPLDRHEQPFFLGTPPRISGSPQLPPHSNSSTSPRLRSVMSLPNLYQPSSPQPTPHNPFNQSTSTTSTTQTTTPNNPTTITSPTTTRTTPTTTTTNRPVTRSNRTINSNNTTPSLLSPPPTTSTTQTPIPQSTITQSPTHTAAQLNPALYILPQEDQSNITQFRNPPPSPRLSAVVAAQLPPFTSNRIIESLEKCTREEDYNLVYSLFISILHLQEYLMFVGDDSPSLQPSQLNLFSMGADQNLMDNHRHDLFNNHHINPHIPDFDFGATITGLGPPSIQNTQPTTQPHCPFCSIFNNSPPNLCDPTMNKIAKKCFSIIQPSSSSSSSSNSSTPMDQD